MADRTRDVVHQMSEETPLDRYYVEHFEQHTKECLEYAACTRRRFCIVECADQRIPPGTDGRPPKS